MILGWKSYFLLYSPYTSALTPARPLPRFVEEVLGLGSADLDLGSSVGHSVSD
jgi:hypothetical protein